MRQNAGEILSFGFGVYAETGDAGFLSRMCNAALETKGVNAGQMINFVKAHANVVWGKGKDGALRFAKEKKGADAIVTTPAVPWWEFGKAKREPSDKLDVTAAIKRLTKKVTEADDSTELDADGLSKALSALQDAVQQHLRTLKLAA